MAAGPDLAAQFRAHFGDADHVYAAMLSALADSWAAGGVARDLFAGREDPDPRQLLQLRLLAGVYRIVLRGDAPALADFYPALGGAASPEGVWSHLEPVLQAHLEELGGSLDVVPQTNEPGRTVALHIGISEAVRRTGLTRIRLLEPGASAGLGLLVDRYRFVGDGWTAGPPDTPLMIAGCGAQGYTPAAFDVVSRRGCDVRPVDLSTPSGEQYLTSFVWPWMTERHERLTAALQVAREHPVIVDQAPASTWLRAQLAAPADPDVLTVVWHSVTRLYWPQPEVEAVEEAVHEARSRMPLAHVALEHRWTELRTEGPDSLPWLELDGQTLARCGHHGPPATLTGSSG